MDSIHCLVLYNLQTPVLSTTTQKMKLLSKYIAEKQLRRTEQLLYIIQKVMASMRENNFLQSARARRTSNKPNNLKAMKKICMPFFHSNLLCSGMRHGDRSLHASAIQGNSFRVTLLRSDNIRLQK